MLIVVLALGFAFVGKAEAGPRVIIGGTNGAAAGGAGRGAMQVTNDMGGSVLAYMGQVNALGNQRVAITGDCGSACTMYLGAPNVCVSPSARLLFHGPSQNGRALPAEVFEAWSRKMADYYPEPIRSWFLREGRNSISGTITLTGRQLIGMGVPQC